VDYTVVAERYFAHMRARDIDGLTKLFTVDATFVLPDGRELRGVAEIQEMYHKLFAAAAPSPTLQAVIAGTQGVAAEIEARMPDGTVRRTANFFHCDSGGLIKRLSIYRRGG
jgi:hypothetical protein